MISKFRILGKEISYLKKPYIIAEACINHEGKISLAKKMIDKAVEAGVSAIKFQFHVLDDEMLRDTPKSSNFSETLYDTLLRTNLNIKEHKYLKNYVGIILFLAEKDCYSLPPWRIPPIVACVMWGKEEFFHKCDLDVLMLVQKCVK